MDDHRGAPRKRVLKGAVVVDDGRTQIVSCIIREMSETGCRIRVGNVFLPQKFDLRIDFDGIVVKSEVVWRKSPDVGLRFIEAPKKIEQKRIPIVSGE